MTRQCKQYTDEELKIICDTSLSSTEVAERIGSTSKAVRMKRVRLREQGVPLDYVPTGRRPAIHYSNDDRELIADMTLSNEEVAAKLGVSCSTIWAERKKLTGKAAKRSGRKPNPYAFSINDEIAAAWQDDPKTLNNKIAKIERLLVNLKNTRDMRTQNNENGFLQERVG